MGAVISLKKLLLKENASGVGSTRGKLWGVQKAGVGSTKRKEGVVTFSGPFMWGHLFRAGSAQWGQLPHFKGARGRNTEKSRAEEKLADLWG